MKYNFSVHILKKQRVDIYLSALFSQLSRSYIQKLIDSGCIKINGEEVRKNTKLQIRDEIHIEEIISSTELLAENIAIDIIYEDSNICVINKDPGINVHPTPWIEGKKGTIVNALLYHCSESLPVISGEERPGIVHRLDKDTSGVLIVAKNDLYMKKISEKIKNREVKKYYIALVEGVIEDTSFTISWEIGRDPNNRIKMTSKNPLNPKNARTHGEVLWYMEEKYSIVKIDLETGRTHQIRVHMADIGHPVVGDSVYGRSSSIIGRQALHAYSYILELYGEEKRFIAPLKEDMQKILKSINIESL